jgi:vesicle coat complex subunit
VGDDDKETKMEEEKKRTSWRSFGWEKESNEKMKTRPRLPAVSILKHIA